jgi:hypothetical protein
MSVTQRAHLARGPTLASDDLKGRALSEDEKLRRLNAWRRHDTLDRKRPAPYQVGASSCREARSRASLDIIAESKD